MEACMEECAKSFPTLDGICEDYATLRLISPAYAGRDGELTAVLQYVFQAIVLGNCGEQKFANTIMKIAVEEMHHMEILGSLICRLGAAPVFTACPPYPVGYYSASSVNYVRGTRQMLCADICAEENAICGYEHILCHIQNGKVAEIIARILEDERRHLKLFNQMLCSLS